MAIIVTLAAFIGMGRGCYAVFRRPDLLRSEHYTLVTRYIEFVGNHDGDPSIRETLGRTIFDLVREHDRNLEARRFRPPDEPMNEETHGP